MNIRSAFAAIATPILIAGLIGVALSLVSGSTQPEAADYPVGPVELDVAPTGLRGQVFQGIVVPIANEGPRSQIGAAVGGFDRSPVGAALAAIHSTVRMSVATDAQWPVVLQQMIAAGPQRDEWAVARTQISITAAISEKAPEITAYRVTSYVENRGEIEIYTTQSDASVTRNTTTVIWQGDRWRLHLPDRTRRPVVATVPDIPAAAVRLELE